MKFEQDGKKKYLSYKPIQVYNWELIVIVDEDVAFASALTLKKNYMLMVICEVVILLLYCGFYIAKVRRISNKSNEFEKDLNVSHTLIQCVRKLSNDTNQKGAVVE